MSPRSLSIVAAIALLAIGAAVFELSRETRDPRFDKVGSAVFPGLIDRVNEIDRLTVESSRGTLHLHRDGEVWKLREADDFPASQNEVSKAILAVAGLAYFEPKTNRPDRYAKLALRDPGEDGAKSRRLMLAHGEDVVADLVVGRETLFLPGLTVGGVYFRLRGDEQAWLGQGKPEAGAEPKDWLRRTIVDIDDRRVRRVVVRHPGGETVVVSKPEEKAETFRLHGIPAGMKLQYDTDADHIGQVLEDLELDDARRAGNVEIDWGRAVVAEAETFDGLRGVLEAVERDDGHWVRVGFEGTTAESRREAEELNAETGDWVYRVAKYEIVAILRRMRDLLIPDGQG